MKRAFLLLVLTVATIVATLVYPQPDPETVAVTLIGTWLSVLAFVGLLIVRGRRGNLIGWVLLGLSNLIAFSLLVTAVAAGGQPGEVWAEAAGWLSLWLAMPGIAGFIIVLLTFPTGTLLSRRWRMAVYSAAAGITLISLGLATRPGTIDNAPQLDNPLAIASLDGIRGLLDVAGTLLLLPALIASLVAMVIRFRRSRGIERQQLRVVAYSCAALPALVLLAMVVDAYIAPAANLDGAINFAGVFLPPAGIGVAMLRYRLYDIDLVINRTIVYTLLTGILAATYLGLVVTLQRATSTFTSGSDLAVAASTLAVAALFRPARARIQVFIDRRFYRARYDARATLARFTESLREDVALDGITVDLLSAVRGAVSPSHASVWLARDEA